MADSYFGSTSGTNGSTSILSPTTPSTGAAARSNALQNRITSVLSASYADLEIRDTLSMLDERDLQNNAETRRNLRLDVQEELIQCNGEIVQDFGQVAVQLKRIGAAIASLNSSCVEMRKHIAASTRETGPMLEEARTIMTEKRQVETKQQLLDAFKTHFVISDADLSTLTSTAEPVNDDFFRVLTRVKKIHEDCQILLGTENQRLGLEILEQSSRQLNAAFQKLYRWVQREFKSLDLENPQISAAIRRALRVLAERPTLFQNCLDFFAEARENILSNNFYAALTGAPLDPDHPVMGKAIELSAHDPLRYISDMLAWAHSATVSEREALEVLFISEGDEIAKGIAAGIESEPWSRADDDDSDVQPFDGRKALNELVDRDLAGVFRQLKQRTEQVIQSHEDATLAYKIGNLVNFYISLFSNLLGEASILLETLHPLSDTAMRAFRSTMRDHVASLHTDLSIATDDLAPPEFLITALETLQVLMKSYDTSIVHLTRAQRIEGFQPILQVALDPFLSGCENVTKRLRSPNSHIFALNCLFATKETLSLYSFANRSDELQPRIDAHEVELIEAVHTWFLHESGLQPLVSSPTSDSLAEYYKDPTPLLSIAQQLDQFLPTATEDARAFLAQLENKVLGRRVIEQAAERFCEDFEEVEAAVLQADELRQQQVNGDAEEEVWVRECFPRTADEIRVLLS